jgi:hypothetical protein
VSQIKAKPAPASHSQDRASNQPKRLTASQASRPHTPRTSAATAVTQVELFAEVGHTPTGTPVYVKTAPPVKRHVPFRDDGEENAPEHGEGSLQQYGPRRFRLSIRGSDGKRWIKEWSKRDEAVQFGRSKGYSYIDFSRTLNRSLIMDLIP